MLSVFDANAVWCKRWCRMEIFDAKVFGGKAG